MTEDITETGISNQATRSQTSETPKSKMDIDTAHAEANWIKNISPDIKQGFENTLSAPGRKLNLPSDSPFWYEVSNQILDTMKEQSPKQYEAAISAQNAWNSIAGREGEKMAEHLTHKMVDTMNEKSKTTQITSPEQLVGTSVGEVVKGTQTSIPTRTDLFTYGVSKYESSNNVALSNVQIDTKKAADKQLDYLNSKIQQDNSTTPQEK